MLANKFQIFKAYKIGEMAKELGVSVRTLQIWDKKGILVAKRTPTNRRYYTQHQLADYFAGHGRLRVAYYCSSNKQREKIKQKLVKYGQKQGIKYNCFMFDQVTDSANAQQMLERQNWQKLMQMIAKRQVAVIYVISRDNFASNSYEFFSKLCQNCQCQITIIN